MVQPGKQTSKRANCQTRGVRPEHLSTTLCMYVHVWSTPANSDNDNDKMQRAPFAHRYNIDPSFRIIPHRTRSMYGSMRVRSHVSCVCKRVNDSGDDSSISTFANTTENCILLKTNSHSSQVLLFCSVINTIFWWLLHTHSVVVRCCTQMAQHIVVTHTNTTWMPATTAESRSKVSSCNASHTLWNLCTKSAPGITTDNNNIPSCA